MGQPVTEPLEAIARWMPQGGPLLIFELDAPDWEDGTGRPREARPADSGSGGTADCHRPQERSAVLLLRAPTQSRLLWCIRAITREVALPPDDRLPGVGERHAGGELGRRLSERERAVLRRLADGDSTKDIAERLCYSERTVKNIVRSLLDKLNCRTRAHAVAVAARHGVV